MEELVIKVPAPFSGIEDLGFTARYPIQEWNERLRDVPFVVEGPAKPMSVLVERLQLFAEKDTLIDNPGDDDAYSWTTPVRLSDELCILAFRDRSIGAEPSQLSDAAASRAYVWNLVRPMAFTFLRDCVRLGELRLAENIAFVLDAGHPPVVDLEMQRVAITPVNGSRLLFSV